MRTTAMWILLGVFVLLGGQPSEAGTGDHAQTRSQSSDHRSGDGRSPSVDPAPVEQYVAIGDSFTSGAGIPPGDDGGCYRSERNYPHRLAERLGADLVDVSCGGATTSDVESAQATDAGANPPQLSGVDRHTDLVTVSLGVNDAGYATLLMRCTEAAWLDREGSPCRASFQTPEGDSLLGAIPAVGQRVERVVRLVHKKAPGAQVVLIGYPQLAPASGTCPELPFATGDYAYLAEFLTDVDTVIRTAARHTDASYVDLLEASEGHDVCAGEDAWVLGASSSPRALAFHPFANEQRAVAALVADALG